MHQVKRFDDGEVCLGSFVCAKEGRRATSRQLLNEERKYRIRPESRCNCKARLVVKFDGISGRFIVQDFRDIHNHVLARPDEVPFLRSHRKINDSQRAEILALGAMGVRKHLMYRRFIAKSGGSYAGVGFTRKDMYNMWSSENMKLLYEGDANTTLKMMAARKKKDSEFFMSTSSVMKAV